MEAPDADELTLTRLPEDILLAVARLLPCHVGLRSLAGSCRLLRGLLRSSGWLEANFAERCAARGWRAPVQPELAPRGWEASASWERRYLSRIGSLPPPHADPEPHWPPSRRTLVVSQKRSGGDTTYYSLRAALEAAADGDTVLVEPGRYEEGAPPVVLRRSITLRGAAPAGGDGGDGDAALPTIEACLLVPGGRGRIVGLSLQQSREVASSVIGAGPLADGATDGARCIAFGGDGVWTCEDCDLRGGIRAGGRADVAVVNCRIVERSPARDGDVAVTGVLVQGAARMLLRCCEVRGHRRSGVTVQQRARLWAQSSLVDANQLAGVKLLAHSARSGCSAVLDGCAVTSNRGMGVLLRERARALLRGCEVRSNDTLGVATLQSSSVELVGCEVGGNAGFGLVCQHQARATLRRSTVAQNTGVGVMAAEGGLVALHEARVTANAVVGVRAEQCANLALHGGNRLWRNGVGGGGARRVGAGAGGGANSGSAAEAAAGGGPSLNLIVRGLVGGDEGEARWTRLEPQLFETPDDAAAAVSASGASSGAPIGSGSSSKVATAPQQGPLGAWPVELVLDAQELPPEQAKLRYTDSSGNE